MPGDETRIDAVIAAPGFCVVGDPTESVTRPIGAFPGRAIAAVVPDDQIRTVVAIGPDGMDLQAVEEFVDGDLARFSVG